MLQVVQNPFEFQWEILTVPISSNDFCGKPLVDPFVYYSFETTVSLNVYNNGYDKQRENLFYKHGRMLQ